MMIIFSHCVQCQTGSVINPDTVAINFLERHPASNRQIIFVHTDNWLYTAGDSIWFAAYCLDEFSHKPQLQSSELFVDLVNDHDIVISQRLLNNRYLKTNGNIVLPQDLPEGNYWLRAYTKNMLSVDSNRMFVKNIYVLSSAGQKINTNAKGENQDAAVNHEASDVDKFGLASKDIHAISLFIAGQSDSSFKLKVDLADTASGIHYILGIQSGDPLFCISGRGSFETEISKRFIPSGESALLLLDHQLNVLVERHVYRLGPGMRILINTDKDNYPAREKVKLDIAISDSGHLPLQAIFSMAVTDNRFRREIASEEFFPYQDSAAVGLITIFHPDEYKTELRKYDDENDLVGIRGTLLNKKGQAMKNQIVTLFGAQQELLFGADTSNEQGRFYFPFYNSQDSFSFQLQVSNFKGKSQYANIVLDSFHFPIVTTSLSLKKKITFHQALFIDSFKTEILDTLINYRGKGWLTPVTITRAKKKQLSYDENKRVSMFSTVITPDMIQKTGYNPVGDAVTMGHGIRLVNGIVNFGSAMSSYAEPLLVIDGAYIDPNIGGGGAFGKSPLLNYLSQIPAEIIDFIELVPPPESAFYGARGANGAIVINTRNTGGIHQSVVTVPVFHARGYSGSPSYSGPDYDNPSIKKSPYPDLRSTIYWNGRVITDENGKAEVEFFASDGPTTYTVRVKGVTTRGDIIDEKIFIRRN